MAGAGVGEGAVVAGAGVTIGGGGPDGTCVASVHAATRTAATMAATARGIGRLMRRLMSFILAAAAAGCRGDGQDGGPYGSSSRWRDSA